MDGKVEHTVQYEGYEFHLCSDHCQKSFEESAEAVLAKLEMPEEQAAPAE
jgi:YHS domain-containing protein